MPCQAIFELFYSENKYLSDTNYTAILLKNSSTSPTW